MSITLENLNTGLKVELPPELFWTDEFQWNKVKGTQRRTITGALEMQVGVAKGGRPITLTAPNDMCWIKRSLLELLYDWANMPNVAFELVLAYDNVQPKTLRVAFDVSEEPVMASPVNEYESPRPDDEFIVTLKFLQITE